MSRLTLFCGLVLFSLPLAAQTEAVDVVDKLQTALMRSAGFSDFSERLQAVSTTIEETHDFSTIARLVTGRHWRTLSATQRTKFLEKFSKLSAMAYAERFKDVGVSKFSHIETLEQPRNSKKVISSLTLDKNASFSEISTKESLSFEYVLHRSDAEQSTQESADSRWQIINVVVDGVSDLALKRSNYASILSEDGFDALIDHLNEKIARIQKTPQ